MRTVYSFLLLLIVSIIQVSCSTVKLTIYGQPNTQILDPEKKLMGTIDHSGSTIIKLNVEEKHYAYLLSRPDGTDKYIPFALNYISRPGKADSRMALYFVSFAVPPLIGGFSWGLPVMMSTFNNDVYYNYSYDKVQMTNDDLIGNDAKSSW